MQDISKALKDRDTKKLRSLIQSKDHVGNMMHTTLNTFKRNLHDILNAAKFDESNVKEPTVRLNRLNVRTTVTLISII